MKFTSSLLWLLVVLLFDLPLVGQNEKKNIELGAQLGVHVFNTNAQISLGGGQSLGAWVTMELQEDTKLAFALAYRQLLDYRFENVQLSEVTFPTQLHREVQVERLIGLNYLDLDVSYISKWSANSRWSWGGGIKLAALVAVRGKQSHTVLVTQGTSYPTETLHNIDYRRSYFQDSRPLSKSKFADLDYGAFAQIGYQLTNNLACTFSYYQGANNVFGSTRFPGQEQHYISQCSLGLSARIY